MEKSIPIDFTIDCLEKKLKEKKVTATIRGKGFIKRFRYRVGSKIEVKFHRKRIGFAVIKDIRTIGYEELFNPEIIEKEGFDSAEDLIKTLKKFWSWHWDKIVNGKMKLPLIEFEWI